MTLEQRETWLRATITRIAGQPADTVPVDADLQEAVGLDSLGRLEVLSEIEDEFDFLIDDQEIFISATITRMLETLERHLAEDAKDEG